MVVDLISRFSSYFWEVFTFWACWQVCDWALTKLKVKLRKPWVVQKCSEEGCTSENTAVQSGLTDSEEGESG